MELSEPPILTLAIKKKWFDMIKEGKKKEEYRDLTVYYDCRLQRYKDKTIIIKLRNGYSRKSPFLIVKCYVGIGRGLTAWGAEAGKEYYVLSILDIL